jgi:hypothetical protein
MLINVVITGRNTSQWVEKCLGSVLAQERPADAITWYDDASEDVRVSRKRIREMLRRPGANPKSVPIGVYTCDVRQGALAHLWEATRGFPDNDEVTVFLAGDDWLAHEKVLSYIEMLYTDPNVWVTYGSYIDTNGQTCTPSLLKDPRNSPYFNFLPLLTWRSKLFSKIAKEDLQVNGYFYTTSADVAFGLPLLEMAGEDRVRAVQVPLCVYNRHDQNDGHVARIYQTMCNWIARQTGAKYGRLGSLDEEPLRIFSDVPNFDQGLVALPHSAQRPHKDTVIWLPPETWKKMVHE